MDEEKLLKIAVENRRPPRRTQAQSIGEVFRGGYLKKLNKSKPNAAAADQWGRLLTAGMKEHSELVSIKNGVITVAVDSGTFMYQMQMAADEMLGRIRDNCPAAGVKKIKLIPRQRK